MTHAPGLSTYNYVERIMALPSKALAGLVIPHDSCGSHLNPSGETVAAEPEKNNFKVAGNILCQIWGKLVLDGKRVTAEYVENESVETAGYDEHWVFKQCKI